MSDNSHGDVMVTLDGKEYALVPSFKAAREIQRATGKPLGQLMPAVLAIDVEVIATVLQQALRCSGNPGFTVDAIGEIVTADLATAEQRSIVTTLQFLNAYFSQKQTEGKKPEDGENQNAG